MILALHQNKNEDISSYAKYLPMGENSLPSLIKFGVVTYGAIFEGKEKDNREKLIQAVSHRYDRKNHFLDKAIKSDYFYMILRLAIENAKVNVLYNIISGRYDDMTEETLRDMFYILSRILLPQIYICLLCEFYIAHIQKAWDIDTYSTNAIFNSILNKDSIENLFWYGLYYPSNGCILSPEQRDVANRMIVAITELNARTWLLSSSYGETFGDIFEVEDYLETYCCQDTFE